MSQTKQPQCVLHLSSEYPPHQVFGLGRYVCDLARAQTRLGHEVHVITNSMGGQDRDFTDQEVHVHRINFPNPPKPVDGPTSVMQFNMLLMERAWQLRDILSTADVVCAHDWLTALAGHVLGNHFQAALVTTIHDAALGKYLGEWDDQRKFIANMEAWACGRSERVICCSEFVKKEVVDGYKARAEKVDVVPCATDATRFRVEEPRLAEFRSALADPTEMVILYVGRLDKEKGVDVLLEAYAKATEIVEKTKLVIAGKGELTGQLKQKAAELGVSNRVRFIGYAAPPVLARLYKVTDLLVCPSLYEPFGIVAIEGMVNGLPVLASETGGLAEIIENGRTGVLVKPGEAAPWAQEICRALLNKELSGKMAAEGRTVALERYNWDRVAGLVRETYDRATNGSEGPRERS